MLEKLEDGRAEVLVRGKRVRCRPEELGPRGPRGRRRQERDAARSRRLRPDALARAGRGDLEERSVPPEINLIGQRVEPALEQLDAYIDQALLASPQARCGWSTATAPASLRQAVREHLRGHRGVVRDPLGRSQRRGRRRDGGDVPRR